MDANLDLLVMWLVIGGTHKPSILYSLWYEYCASSYHQWWLWKYILFCSNFYACGNLSLSPQMSNWYWCFYWHFLKEIMRSVQRSLLIGLVSHHWDVFSSVTHVFGPIQLPPPCSADDGVSAVWRPGVSQRLSGVLMPRASSQASGCILPL